MINRRKRRINSILQSNAIDSNCLEEIKFDEYFETFKFSKKKKT